VESVVYKEIEMKIRGFEIVSKEQWVKDSEKAYRSQAGTVEYCCSYDDLRLPHRKTSRSAGYDVISPFSFFLKPGDSVLIPTGFKAYMLTDEVLVFHVRSSHGFKNFIRLANTTGIGDSDYYDNPGNEGHYFVKLRNEGTDVFMIESGEAIAQCIFMEYLLADGDDYNGTERIGGIGSTG
jgi:dUTP pyrophosphatase